MGKLLQESFLEQLDALQALDQLAPFTAAKERLPGDIIDTHLCYCLLVPEGPEELVQ